MENILEKTKFNIIKTETYEIGAKYDVLIKIPMSLGWISSVSFIVENNNTREIFRLDHVKNDEQFSIFKTTITLPTKAIYHYYFSFNVNNQSIYLKKENQKEVSTISPSEMWQMSVNFEVPKWAKGKIMYHIFVDRFNKGREEPLPPMENRTFHSNWDEDIKIGPDENGIWNADFYGGDLKGIIDKLDYIKSLGVSIIYLSPIVWSQSNHRYDTSDYEKVDPYAGTNEDLKNLCTIAHQKGIKIILDAVFNHTGNDSKYFNEYNHFNELGASQSPESKYYPFYRKYIADNKTYFDYWWGMKNLPVCDGSNKEWQNYIYGEGGIIDLWFSLGIDGLRLDVADELSDEFIEGIRTAVKRNKKDGFIIGEVWKNPMRMNRNYISGGKGMDTVMNYTLIDALIRYFKYEDVHKLRDVINQLKTEYPIDTLNSLMNFTSTHDITRAINIFGTHEFRYSGEWAWNLNNESDLEWQKNYQLSFEEYQRGKEIYKAYLYVLTFFPGILSIFYGDEVGLQGMGNLANRRPFPWHNIDKDLLKFFQSLGEIRQKEQFLEEADLEIIEINNEYIMFKRHTLTESILIAVNRSNGKIKIFLPEEYTDYEKTYFLGKSSKEELDSYGALVLKKKNNHITPINYH